MLTHKQTDSQTLYIASPLPLYYHYYIDRNGERRQSDTSNKECTNACILMTSSTRNDHYCSLEIFRNNSLGYEKVPYSCSSHSNLSKPKVTSNLTHLNRWSVGDYQCEDKDVQPPHTHAQPSYPRHEEATVRRVHLQNNKVSCWGPLWCSGIACILGALGSASARVRILATVRGEIGHPLGVTVP